MCASDTGCICVVFREVPPLVPTDGSIVYNGFTLLYAGIAPKAPPMNDTRPSERTLWHRIRYHVHGNAYGSTLRLTLGCLLAERLGIELRRVGRGKRRTFAEGEAKLSEWMGENARVCWIETSQPWLLEAKLIASVCLPLNLDQNRSHAFPTTLSGIRREAKRRAGSPGSQRAILLDFEGARSACCVPAPFGRVRCDTS